MIDTVYKLIGVAALAIMAGVALAQVVTKDTEKKKPVKPKISRWIAACEIHPKAEKDTAEERPKEAPERVLQLPGATCYRTGSTGTRITYTCKGRAEAKERLVKRACKIYEYDGIKKIGSKEATTKKAMIRGSTCIGQASMTWRKQVKKYQIWPCAWNGKKPGFRVKKIESYGPGVIRGDRLRRIVGLDADTQDAEVKR